MTAYCAASRHAHPSHNLALAPPRSRSTPVHPLKLALAGRAEWASSSWQSYTCRCALCPPYRPSPRADDAQTRTSLLRPLELFDARVQPPARRRPRTCSINSLWAHAKLRAGTTRWPLSPSSPRQRLGASSCSGFFFERPPARCPVPPIKHARCTRVGGLRCLSGTEAARLLAGGSSSSYRWGSVARPYGVR